MPSWVIQVASLGTPESAGELESRLRDGGFSAFVEKAEINGKLYYRVRVGPEADRASAERTASQLRDRHRLDTLIQSYP
jgi:DedD protein